MNKFLFFIFWVFGITVGLLINGCIAFYNIGWNECSKKFSVELGKQKDFFKKGAIKTNE